MAGAVYLFKRVPPEIGRNNEVVKESFWLSTEHGRIAPPDVAARDRFGYSLALDGNTAVIGAVDVDGKGESGGAVFVVDTKWDSVKFAKVEYRVLEGTLDEALIFVERDASDCGENLTIGYSTSDLSARGVVPKEFALCKALSIEHRHNCGDHERVSGKVRKLLLVLPISLVILDSQTVHFILFFSFVHAQLYFAPGESNTFFSIKVMDAYCRELEMEYVQLNLHIPGGGVIHGENYRSHMRIDDNDWGDDPVKECTR